MNVQVRSSWIASLTVLSVLACGPDKDELFRRQAAEKTAAFFREEADKADAQAAALEAEVKHAEAVEAMFERKIWAKINESGRLGPHAFNRLEIRKTAGGAIETLVQDGKKIEEFGDPLVEQLNLASDDARAIEPFAMKIEDYRAKPALAAMPHHVTVDGLDIGFADLGMVPFDAPMNHPDDPRADDWCYLIAWYYRGAVVGLVYHSQQQLDFATLERETAPIIASIRAAQPKRMPG